MTTTEQLEGREALRGYLAAAGLPLVRVKADAENWPFAPATLGRVEWQGPEWDGSPDRLCVFTDRQIVTRLLEIPGVERHQMGKGEARLRFMATDTEALRQVCRLIRARTRRPSIGRSAEELARIRPLARPVVAPA